MKKVEVIGFSEKSVSEYASNFTQKVEKPDLNNLIFLKISESENLMVLS